MSNIPTLALIPSAYKTSKVYSVLPSNGDGDFTFSRTTVATRVNKDGFIETVGESLSDELVTNGGFYTDTDWTKQNGSTISGGVATIISNGAITSTAGNRAIQQDNVFVAGKTYEINFIARQTVGSGKLQIGNGFSSLVQKDLTSEFNTYSFRVVAGAVNSADHIISVGGLTVSDEFEVKDISVKEVLIDTNIPRIDYSDGGCPSLLLEPQRTNTFLNSEPTSNENAGSGVTYESYFWGNGLQKSIVFGDNSVVRYRYGGTGTLNESNTLSFYIKMDDLGEPFPSLSSSGSNKDFAFVIGGDVLANYFSKKYVGNNIWRVQATRNTTASWSNSGFNGILKSTGHSNRGFKATGFQLELGSYATSYIPTNGSISTRNQDYCNGAGDATLFNDKEGVLYVETKGFVDVPTASGYIQLSKSGESSFDNSLVIQHRNNGFLRIYTNGTASTDLHFNIDIDFTQNHKIAVLYKLNGYKLFIDGVAQSLFGTPTQTVFSGLNDLSFDNRGTLGWNGKVKDLRYYNTELTDAELIELTT